MKKNLALLAVILTVAVFAHSAWQVLWKITGTGSRRNTTEFLIQPANTTDGTAADFISGTTNTNALGTSSVRFSNVFSTLLNVSGVSTLTGGVAVTGASTFAGTVTNSTSTYGPAPTAQTVAAADTIIADACGGIKRISSAGSVTTNTTNTFSAPAAANAGCVMFLVNSGSNNIVLDNNALFVSAGAADVTMTANDALIVSSDGSKWYQISALLAN